MNWFEFVVIQFLCPRPHTSLRGTEIVKVVNSLVHEWLLLNKTPAVHPTRLRKNDNRPNTGTKMMLNRIRMPACFENRTADHTPQISADTTKARGRISSP